MYVGCLFLTVDLAPDVQLNLCMFMIVMASVHLTGYYMSIHMYTDLLYTY